MSKRAHDLLADVCGVQEAAEDVIDTINSWGLGQHPASLYVLGCMEVVSTSTSDAAESIRKEIDRYPEEVGPRRGSFIVTRTGRRFWPLDPRAEEVDLEDIAHALSYKCRWGAMCEPFYSVAEHSLNVARLARQLALRDRYPHPDEAWAFGLIHDGEEAYLPDVPRPVKRHLRGWERIAGAVQDAITEAFGLGIPSAEVIEYVHIADELALLIEQRVLFVFNPEVWAGGLPTREVPAWAIDIHARVRGTRLGVVKRAFTAGLRKVMRLQPAGGRAPIQRVIASRCSGQSWRDEMKNVITEGGVGLDCRVCAAPNADPIIRLCQECMG